MEMRTYLMQTRSGLHCGVGQGLSDIDLPTAKDSVTGHPLVPGSSIKGVLRDRFDNGSKEALVAFGSPSGSSVDYAGALSFTDSRLVCLPVRSYFGTYAMLTSRHTLRILKEELENAGLNDLPDLPSFQTAQENDNFHALVCTDTRLVHQGQYAVRLLLEDLDLLVDMPKENNLADQWAEVIGRCLYTENKDQKEFSRGFAIVDDNVFDFFCEACLPVAAHNRIGKEGVVVDGGLWYEEFVPAEAVFSGSIYSQDVVRDNKTIKAKDLLNLICSNSITIQVGGSATTGRGLVTMFFCQYQGGQP
ncbi:MAG: type III-B CRISPR module RAMP protein Cmr4 [Deltaproteobacteria bacterium]|nr:MAG: type III-B CRISPR module RAMP protein Cmr4 [Deltaproteobacteria bacterium]